MVDRARRWPRGRCVAITGAAGGIGSALARRFGRAGAQLVLLDLDGAGAESLAAELTASGAPALAIACDVTSLEACRRAVEHATQRFGGIDVLIANAGISHLSRFRETEVAVIRRVMEVNFFGAVNIAKAALETLVARRGRIGVLSSLAGIGPLATRSGYAASKHALHGFFESLRAELVASGVQVTMICPAFVRTGIGDRALGGDGGPPRMQQTRVGVPADPDETADAIFEALRRGRRLALPSRTARLAYLVSRLFPASYERLMIRGIVPDRES